MAIVWYTKYWRSIDGHYTTDSNAVDKFMVSVEKTTRVLLPLRVMIDYKRNWQSQRVTNLWELFWTYVWYKLVHYEVQVFWGSRLECPYAPKYLLIVWFVDRSVDECPKHAPMLNMEACLGQLIVREIVRNGWRRIVQGLLQTMKRIVFLQMYFAHIRTWA